jgi:hypothetical protein
VNIVVIAPQLVIDGSKNIHVMHMIAMDEMNRNKEKNTLM